MSEHKLTCQKYGYAEPGQPATPDPTVDCDCKPTSPARVPEERDDYVAWCKYFRHGNTTTIRTCDSDAPGAFKVYRSRPTPTPELEDEVVAAADQIMWQVQIKTEDEERLKKVLRRILAHKGEQ